MTKEELLKALKESNVVHVKKAEDTLQNIETKKVSDAKTAAGITGLSSELPTQKDVEKIVDQAVDPVVPADKEGISKNGGNDNRMSPDEIEAERKKEDNEMKDIINVSSRKVAENNEVSKELLEQLQEASLREAQYKAKIEKIINLCEKALDDQQEALVAEHKNEIKKIFEALIVEGEKLEESLVADSEKNKKMYLRAKKLYESSIKLNKALVEAVKKAQPKRELTRYSTPGWKAVASLRK